MYRQPKVTINQYNAGDEFSNAKNFLVALRLICNKIITQLTYEELSRRLSVDVQRMPESVTGDFEKEFEKLIVELGDEILSLRIFSDIQNALTAQRVDLIFADVSNDLYAQICKVLFADVQQSLNDSAFFNRVFVDVENEFFTQEVVSIVADVENNFFTQKAESIFINIIDSLASQIARKLNCDAIVSTPENNRFKKIVTNIVNSVISQIFNGILVDAMHNNVDTGNYSHLVISFV